MEDRSKIIYGNEIGRKAYRNAIHSKKKFIKKYGDDTGTKYPVRLRKNAVLGDTLGIVDVRVAKKHGTAGEKNQTIPFDTERALLWEISAWASVITAFPWRLLQRHMQWAMYRTGWI